MARLTGKVAIVTGGASGIGLASARRFVAEGARVMIGDVDVPRLDAVSAELGDGVAGRQCDVRDEADVEALAAEWTRVIEVNLLGPLLTIKHAARPTSRRRSRARWSPPRPNVRETSRLSSGGSTQVRGTGQGMMPMRAFGSAGDWRR
jgi:NAD(P)-dependent dehydrogenase (short-subunit alcohol dehydrogenase family)